jgi:hypothetical protein
LNPGKGKTMEDTITVKINDKDVKFGFIGRQFRLNAVKEIRAQRYDAFQKAISNLPSDPVSTASQIGSSIDAYMTSVIVGDQDINHWLSTPEGFFFTFKESLKRVQSDATDDIVENFHDRLGEESMGKLRDYWGRALDGTRWDDIYTRVEEQARADVLAYAGASEEVLEAFSKFLESRNENSGQKSLLTDDEGLTDESQAS